MTDPDADTNFVRIRLERDLYRDLLDLGHCEHPGAFLEEALGIIVRVLGAEQGYLEVSDPQDGPTWWRAAGCSDEQVEVIRSIVSRGIIAEALALGEAIVCPSALLDPRFRDRPSVQASRIEQVLCVPIGQRAPVGVLYVQGRRSGGPFSDDEVERARTFARHLAPLVEALFVRSRQKQADHVAPYRSRLRIDGVIGTSEAIAAIVREVELVGPLQVAVLVTGETGTGKTQLARVIHDNGPRRARPFVEVNCAAIQDNLVENELFGAVPGGHSGGKVEGKVTAARGGTLFLDEIGELSSLAQSKVLQFLDTKTYYPVGAATPLTADVRIIAATNVDLQEAVRERRFRQDLFFRLQVLCMRMPSLAERREDVVPLAEYFRKRAQEANHLPQLSFSPSALRAIDASEWRGNVRELAHAVEAAAIRASAEGVRAIEATHIFKDAAPKDGTRPAALTFQAETRRFQAALVERTLQNADWSVAAAARTLDITRAHLYNLIKGFGLSRHRAPQ